MARNEEKHFGKLNRLLLQKERDENLKHNPKRPKLDSFQTAEEIIQWIPSIKADMNFYLKQTQVTCYCDQKVMELREKVNQFEREYKAFLRRARQLNPKGLDFAPWTPRSYKSINDDEPLPVDEEKKAFAPISTPILHSITPVEKCQPHSFENLPLNDQPLQFNNCGKTYCQVSCNPDLEDNLNSSDVPMEKESSDVLHACNSQQGFCPRTSTTSLNQFHHTSVKLPSLCEHFVGICNNNVDNFSSENDNLVFVPQANVPSKNILGLDYESSSGDDDNENS